jgi:hypothetical protein
MDKGVNQTAVIERQKINRIKKNKESQINQSRRFRFKNQSLIIFKIQQFPILING